MYVLGARTPFIPMEPFKIVKVMVAILADGHEIVGHVFIADALIGQVVNVLGWLFAHDAKTVVNRQPFSPFRLPLRRCDVLVVIHISLAVPLRACPGHADPHPAGPCLTQPMAIVCHQTTTVGVYPVPPETCKPFPFAG